MIDLLTFPVWMSFRLYQKTKFAAFPDVAILIRACNVTLRHDEFDSPRTNHTKGVALDSKIETPRVVIDDSNNECDFNGKYQTFPAPQPEVDSDESESELADKELEITRGESNRKGRARKGPKKRPSTVAQAKAPKLRPAGGRHRP